jgi:periplasmic protein CpxP/Spy
MNYRHLLNLSLLFEIKNIKLDMKFKYPSLLIGTIVLIFAALPFTVQAQNKFDSPMPILEMVEQGPLQRLGLSDNQKNQIEQIRRNTRSQIEEVITAEQREQFKTTFKGGQGFPGAMLSMKLTPEQQGQLQKILEDSKTKVESVLTLEQKQKIALFREKIMARMEQRLFN